MSCWLNEFLNRKFPEFLPAFDIATGFHQWQDQSAAGSNCRKETLGSRGWTEKNRFENSLCEKPRFGTFLELKLMTTHKSTCWILLTSPKNRSVPWLEPWIAARQAADSTLEAPVDGHVTYEVYSLVGGATPSEKYDFVNWDDNRNPIFLGK